MRRERARVLLGLAIPALAALTVRVDTARAAGNVKGAVIGAGVLELTGDNLGNQFHLSPSGPTDVLVEGNTGTTINGAAMQTFANVRSLRIETGNGDDVIEIEDVVLTAQPGVVSGFLNITSGGGADKIDVDDVVVTGISNIRSGTGNDTIILSTSDFRRRLKIVTADGNDIVNTDLVSVGVAGAGAIDKEFELSTGKGVDVVTLDTDTFDGPVRVEGDEDNDTITSQGSTFKGRVHWSGNEDNDCFKIGGSTFMLNVQLNGNRGVNGYDDLGGNTFPVGSPQLRNIAGAC